MEGNTHAGSERIGPEARTTAGTSGRRPTRAPSVRVGTSLGRYLIQDFLGRGGMGRVYRAQGPDGDVALKLIHPQYLEQEDFLRRFLLEAGAGKRVRHPNVVRTKGVEIVPFGDLQQALLVMEYVPGRTLLQWQLDEGRAPDTLLREIAAGLAAGLQAIHGAGVIHRDLKPENVMLTSDRRVKIMDLGVARLRTDEVRLSRTGHFVGSLLFAAPEQLSDSGMRSGPAADLYAAGLVLYVLATGDHPFPYTTAGEVINAHLNEDPIPVRERAPDVSPFMEALIHCLLEKRPADRFPTALLLKETVQAGDASSWWLARRAHLASAEDVPTPARAQPAHGRPMELRELASCWRHAHHGRGRLVLVRGEAGIGKSRLVDAFVDGLAMRPGMVGIGQCANTSMTHGALAEVLTALSADAPAFERAKTSLDGEPRLRSALEALTTDSPDVPVPETEDVERAVTRVIGRMAEEAPRVLVFEDVDAMTPAERHPLEALARLAPRCPLLLLVTLEPNTDERLRDRLLCIRHARSLEMRDLAHAAATRLISDQLGSSTLAGELAPELLARAGGNPLYLSALLEDMKARHALEPGPGGRWQRAAGTWDAGVPTSLRRLFDARLGDLDIQHMALLEAAVVQGDVFELPLIAAVLDRSVQDVTGACEQLTRAPRLLKYEDDTWHFDPPLLRDVLLDRLAPGTLRSLHARSAEALELGVGPTMSTTEADVSVRITRHRLRAGQAPLIDSHVLPALSRLEGDLCYDAYVALSDEILEQGTGLPAPLLLEILSGRVRVFEILGRRDQQRRALRAVRTHASKHGLSMPSAVEESEAQLLFERGELEEAHTRFERRLAEAVQAEDRVAESRASRALGRVVSRQGDSVAARRLHERGLLLARSARCVREELACHDQLATWFESQGLDARARLHRSRHLDQSVRVGDLGQAARAHGGLARVAARCGRFREAQVHYDRELHLARDLGDRAQEGRALRGLGRLHLARGRLTLSRESLDRAERVATEAGRELDAAAVWVDRARLSLLCGEPDDLMRHSMRALSKAQRLHVAGLETAALTLAGLAAEEREDWDEALDWYEQALGERQRGRPVGGEIGTQLGLARVLRHLGHARDASALLRRVIETSRALGLVGPQIVACAMSAAGLDLSATSVLALLVSHVDHLTVHERLQVHLELAAATGDPQHARDASSLLADLAADLGTPMGQLAAGYSLYRRTPLLGVRLTPARSAA